MYELTDSPPKKKIKKRRGWKFPRIAGRYGVSFMVRDRELFLGVQVVVVEVAPLLKRRVKSAQGRVNIVTLED